MTSDSIFKPLPTIARLDVYRKSLLDHISLPGCRQVVGYSKAYRLIEGRGYGRP